jgi:hypothetical protein
LDGPARHRPTRIKILHPWTSKAMCAKRQRRCAVLLKVREEALKEWTVAETYSDVCRAWGRLGGRTTLHRYGRQHFSGLARTRWGYTRRPAGR